MKSVDPGHREHGDGGSRSPDTSRDSPDAARPFSEHPTDGTLGSTVDLPIEQIAADEIVSGTFVGRYRLVKRLGRGGTGEVWQGRDPHLSRFVAVKLIRSDLYVSPELKEAFLREGRRLAQLAHPSIVEIFDVGVATNRPFLVTRFAEGGTLADRIDQGRPSAKESAAWLAQVARAAHFAHLQGVVHRDVKPSNILLDGNGQALLGDFGLAISEEEQVHERPSTLGTYAFMSPEQLRGASHAVDGRADIYALGVTLYLCLTGRLPFLADNPSLYRKLVLEREPRPLRSIEDAIDTELERICLKCLAREPGARYTTALDLAQELEDWVARRRRANAALSRRFLLPALLAISLVGALGLGWTLFWRLNEASPSAIGPAASTAAASDEISPPSKSAFEERMQLLSPSEAAFSSYLVSDDRESVVLSSDRTALLRMGGDSSGVKRISIDVVRSKPDGTAGLFWGRRIEDRNGTPSIVFFSCGIMSVGDRSQLYVAEHSVPEANLAAFVAKRLIRVQGIEGPVSTITRIDLRNVGEEARPVVTNGRTVLSVSPDPEEEGLPKGPGEFGVYCYRANVEFRNWVRE